MEDKARYLKAMIESNGHLNEIDLGQKIGLGEGQTREIISHLLSEHKIEYKSFGLCNYSIIKKRKHFK